MDTGCRFGNFFIWNRPDPLRKGNPDGFKFFFDRVGDIDVAIALGFNEYDFFQGTDYDKNNDRFGFDDCRFLINLNINENNHPDSFPENDLRFF